MLSYSLAHCVATAEKTVKANLGKYLHGLGLAVSLSTVF